MITEDRKVYIIGDIDHAAYKEFTKKLGQLEMTKEPIHIVLMSDGGDPDVALAFHDRIKMSRCKISLTGIGLVASAAALILVAAPERSMTKNAWLMVHDTTLSDLDDKPMSQIRKTLEDRQTFEKQWCRLMAEATGGTPRLWKDFHENETYLTAAECKTLGVIQEII